MNKKQIFVLAVALGSMAFLTIIAALIGMSSGFQGQGALAIVVVGCVILAGATVLTVRSRPSTWRDSKPL